MLLKKNGLATLLEQIYPKSNTDSYLCEQLTANFCKDHQPNKCPHGQGNALNTSTTSISPYKPCRSESVSETNFERTQCPHLNYGGFESKFITWILMYWRYFPYSNLKNKIVNRTRQDGSHGGFSHFCKFGHMYAVIRLIFLSKLCFYVYLLCYHDKP